MIGGPDLAAVVLRALAFVAVFPAAGLPVFLLLYGQRLTASGPAVLRLGIAAALTGAVLTGADQLLQPARMTGTFVGLLDGSLHAILWASDTGPAVALRVLGLLAIAVTLRGRSRAAEAGCLIAATLVVSSFAFMGHTATGAGRWLLAPLLIVHLLAVAFWLGALPALYLVAGREAIGTAAAVIDAFSRTAIAVVPAIFVAGLGLSVVLLPDVAALASPYGALLIAKLGGFLLLMALAAVNKWRLGPAIGSGRTDALRRFRRVVAAEAVLIAAVLAITATMTTFYSPGA